MEADLETKNAAWRRKLLARLAAERARLLRQLRGIDEKTLSTFTGDQWTAVDVLAHLGSWDAFHTERMSLVLNGRINAIRELGGEDAMDARNAVIHAFSRRLSLEQALAICLKERSGFLATLARIPDELLHREIEMPWQWRTHMRDWATWRYEHDAHHAAQLGAWRQALAPEQKRQVGPIYLLRALFSATRKEFLTLVNLLPAAERETRPICGVWSLGDLVGHLTDWELVGLAGMRQLAAGRTPEFDEPIDDFDVWNNAHAAARQDQPWETVWAGFKAARSELLTLMDQLTADDWQRPFTAPWGSTINGYSWASVWAGHEHEHAHGLRQALGLRP